MINDDEDDEEEDDDVMMILSNQQRGGRVLGSFQDGRSFRAMVQSDVPAHSHAKMPMPGLMMMMIALMIKISRIIHENTHDCRCKNTDCHEHDDFSADQSHFSNIRLQQLPNNMLSNGTRATYNSEC